MYTDYYDKGALDKPRMQLKLNEKNILPKWMIVYYEHQIVFLNVYMHCDVNYIQN